MRPSPSPSDEVERPARPASLPLPILASGALSGAGAPVLDPATLEDDLRAERERLIREAGLDTTRREHFRRPAERPFIRAERDRVTIWFGGLTFRHEQLIHAALEGLGYRPAIIPTPEKADFQAGKEYGNNGQCNPTYFTVGALVNHLKRMRDEEGVPLRTILDEHVFFTAGACGPCRFGMYEAEYRLALRNSGFEGFRVLLFQQKGGLAQESADAGLAFDLDFFLSVLNAFLIGDLLNELAYQIRPYEMEAGATDRALAACLERCRRALRAKDHHVREGVLAHLVHRITPVDSPRMAAAFLDQLGGSHYVDALRECREILDAVEVDLLRPRPICKITGEFWAQTTEGDGNFRMFSFLEREGAEVLVEPVTTWIDYMLHQVTRKVRDRAGLEEDAPRATGAAPTPAAARNGSLRRLSEALGLRLALARYGLAQRALGREYDRFRRALGGTAHPLASQLELTRVGHPYYDSRSGGGEGHLEVAKNIYYANRDLAHMVLSLKPFGCMPSTQSDGAQAAVTSHFPEMIYLPVETSGEGDINAYSRVQMALGEAKARCKAEFKEAVARTGYSLEALRAYAAERPELRRPFQPLAREKGVVGRAATFALHVGAVMSREGIAPNGSAAAGGTG